MMEFEFLGEYMEMLLEACLGMSIESIGSLEVPFTFEGCNDLVPALTIIFTGVFIEHIQR
jgi:hypothetical protein